MLKMPTLSPVLTKAEAWNEMRWGTFGISLLRLPFLCSLWDSVLKHTECNTVVVISVIYHPIIDINVEAGLSSSAWLPYTCSVTEKEAYLLRTVYATHSFFFFPPHIWCQLVSLDLRVMSGRRRWAMSFTACGSVLLHIWIGKAEVSAGEQSGGIVSLNDLDHSFNQILHFVMQCV